LVEFAVAVDPSHLSLLFSIVAQYSYNITAGI
jgi:hypothetical protein